MCKCGKMRWKPQPRDAWAACAEAQCSACHGRRFKVETYGNGKARLVPLQARTRLSHLLLEN